jgi:hypothetical protein
MSKLPLNIGNGFTLLQHQAGIGMSQTARREVKRKVRLPGAQGSPPILPLTIQRPLLVKSLSAGA